MAVQFQSASGKDGGRVSLTFKEGYELDEPFIARFSFPGLHDNSIIGVSGHMFRMRVELYEYMTSS